MEVWQTSNVQRLRLGEEMKEEEEERKKEETTGQNIMSASATQGGHNKCTAQTRMTLRSELFDIYFYFFKHT